MKQGLQSSQSNGVRPSVHSGLIILSGALLGAALGVCVAALVLYFVYPLETPRYEGALSWIMLLKPFAFLGAIGGALLGTAGGVFVAMKKALSSSLPAAINGCDQKSRARRKGA